MIVFQKQALIVTVKFIKVIINKKNKKIWEKNNLIMMFKKSKKVLIMKKKVLINNKKVLTKNKKVKIKNKKVLTKN